MDTGHEERAVRKTGKGRSLLVWACFKEMAVLRPCYGRAGGQGGQLRTVRNG